MSIINEALKKTQQTRKIESEKKQLLKSKAAATPSVSRAKEKQNDRLSSEPLQKVQADAKKHKPVQKAEAVLTWRMTSYLTVTGLLVIMALANYEQLVPRVNAFLHPGMNVAAASAGPSSMPASAAVSPGKVKVAFEGVFTADNAKVALINKKSLRVGDSVNGMTIVAINEESVDLQGRDGLIEIKAGATYLL